MKKEKQLSKSTVIRQSDSITRVIKNEHGQISFQILYSTIPSNKPFVLLNYC